LGDREGWNLEGTLDDDEETDEEHDDASSSSIAQALLFLCWCYRKNIKKTILNKILKKLPKDELKI